MRSRNNNSTMSRQQEIDAAKFFGKHLHRDKLIFCFVVATLMSMLPCLAGLSHYDAIPQIVETGLVNAEGQDDSLPRWALVFLLPAVFTLCSVICHVQLWIHQKRQTVPPKQIRLLGRWSVAVLSVLFCTWAEYSAIGESYSLARCVAGIALILLGVAMFDCKPGAAVALPFAFAKSSEEMWKKTHRICAKLIVTVGLAVLVGIMFHGSMSLR